MNKKKEFEKIYLNFVDKIFRFLFLKTAHKAEAEDLTAQTFQKAWETFKSEGIENPSAFLYRVAQNLATDFYRKKGRAQILPLNEKTLEGKSSNPYKTVEIQLDFEPIKAALQKLEADEQNVLIWYYIEEMKIKEIAQILNKSEGATRVLIHRALNKLRKNLNFEKS